jgi:hypothetical protein
VLKVCTGADSSLLRKTIGVTSSFPLLKKSNEVLVKCGLFDIKGEWLDGIQILLLPNRTCLSKSAQFEREAE